MNDADDLSLAMFSELPKPPIKVTVSRRPRGHLADISIEDGDRSFGDAVDLREEKNRRGVIRKLTARWPDLKDDTARANHVLTELDRFAASLMSNTSDGSDGEYVESDADPPRYFEQDGGLFWSKPTNAGFVAVPLTNFTARIVAEITLDDGVTQSKHFEIECRVGTTTRTIRVSVEAFGRMLWPIEHLGVEAIIYAGMGTKDHSRTAIQFLSPAARQRVVRRHLGWTKVNDRHFFLHAGGAVGGASVEIEVEIEPQLGEFVQPAPPSGDALHLAVRASLRFLGLSKPSVTAPIFAAVYRSVIPVVTDFAMWVHGPSGVMKSEIAALAQQHFGAGMDRTHLPAAWSSTANFNEKLAFLAKDVLLTVDDFAPQPGNADRLHRDAERLLRSQGNRSGRGRMTQSALLTIAQPPRGLLLGTGEDVPRGFSLRGRLFAVAIAKGDIDVVRLTELQALAADGAFARSMASFIVWLASRIDRLDGMFNTYRTHVRELLRSSGHARNPDQVAHLMFGVDAFLVFAIDTGAISQDDFLSYRRSTWEAIVGVALEQTNLQIGEDPVVQFVSLLSGAITSGAAALDPAPRSPQCSEGESDISRDSLTPRIGWMDAEGVYLESQSAFAVVQQLAKKQGTEIPVTLGTLRKRLYEANLLREVEHNSEGKVTHFEPKKQFGSKRIRVMCLRADYADYPELLGRAGRAGREGVPQLPPIPAFAPVAELLGREPGRTETPPDHPLEGSIDVPESDPSSDNLDADGNGWTEDPEEERDDPGAEATAP